MTEHISLITPDRLDNLRRAVEMTRDLPGDMAELGVYRGGSARVIAEVCPEKVLHLFDTFAGLPYGEWEQYDPKGLLKAGDFACSLEEVKTNLVGCNVEYHQGRFISNPEGIIGPLSFVHIDCDLYDVARDGIHYFWPKLVRGGIIYFDDYGCDFTGVTTAVDRQMLPEWIEKQYDVNGFQIGAYVVKI
jgi:O-methyltransferase